MTQTPLNFPSACTTPDYPLHMPSPAVHSRYSQNGLPGCEPEDTTTAGSSFSITACDCCEKVHAPPVLSLTDTYHLLHHLTHSTIALVGNYHREALQFSPIFRQADCSRPQRIIQQTFPTGPHPPALLCPISTLHPFPSLFFCPITLECPIVGVPSDQPHVAGQM
jgi:hypothetical protein